MPRDAQRVGEAAQRQKAAARDAGTAVRVVAGPGSGKSQTIEQRVEWLLREGVNATHIFVVSFTRAAARELKERIVKHCLAAGHDPFAHAVDVSTMHALALKALRKGNLLGSFPARPMILDDWEQEEIFDAEFSEKFNVTPSRIEEIRLAYDAYWQTLQDLALADVSTRERERFTSFHGERTTQYSCILPGEIVRRCVDNMRNGILSPRELLGIDHLVADEFQDLNACDQEFVRRIHGAGAHLWVAGDDDQSIYSFRHADPSGIRNFEEDYPDCSAHTLSDCFRCTPAIIDGASRLVSVNPNRIEKENRSLYENTDPTCPGKLEAWRFPNGGAEARALAESCKALIDAGIEGQEILILIAHRRVQLQQIEEELSRAQVAFAAPRGPELTKTDMGRLLLATLRVSTDKDDYVAHRTVLGLLKGVGTKTCIEIAESATAHNLNFLDVFYGGSAASIFTGRALKAITRAGEMFSLLERWNADDELIIHDETIDEIIVHVLGEDSARSKKALDDWHVLRCELPDGMHMDELKSYFWADRETEQLRILQTVESRLDLPQTPGSGTAERVRILTMHGAKGLGGKVVFIPGFEQEIHPSRRALASPGLLQERRRLMYVSITRAKAACFLTMAKERVGAPAKVIAQEWSYYPIPSPFVNELETPVNDRHAGLSPQEVLDIMADCANL